MSDIKELSDDELASVTGGTGGGANCKYPTGTTFIIVNTKLDEAQTYIEIISADEQDGAVYYLFRYYGKCGVNILFDMILDSQMPEEYLDDCIAQGLIEKI